MVIDKGYDENLEILYQVRICTENDRDDVDYGLLDICYRSLDELMEDLS